MTLKYIIVQDFDEYAIVFNSCLTHSEVGRFYERNGQIVSAGMCDLENGISVWGRSTTLQKDSRPEDKDIIQKQFFSRE